MVEELGRGITPPQEKFSLNDTTVLKQSINILDLIGHDTSLKKVADTGGGEFAGACPFCGGKDRFRVQPYKNNGKWFCRGCGDNHWHDVFDYIQLRDKVSFDEALSILAPGKNPTQQQKWEPNPPEIDRPQWVKSSYEFLEMCINHLWGEVGRGAREYLHWRGLDDSTIEHWDLGYNPSNAYGVAEEWGIPDDKKLYLPKGIVIPCHDAAGLHYLKVRRSKSKPKYLLLKGGNIWPYGLQTYMDTVYGFLFEGEFDVMLAYQTGFTGVGYAALPAGQPIKKDYQHFFSGIEDVIVAFDTDEEGQKAADGICKLPHFHKAGLYPQGNDLSEYWQHTQNMEEVFQYLYKQLDHVGVN